jgi:hypothetical protein
MNPRVSHWIALLRRPGLPHQWKANQERRVEETVDLELSRMLWIPQAIGFEYTKSLVSGQSDVIVEAKLQFGTNFICSIRLSSLIIDAGVIWYP